MPEPSPTPFARLAVPALLLAGLLAYANSLTKDLVLDDNLWIAGNSALRDPAGPALTLGGRPLVDISLWVNYQLGGLNVVGYHVVNVAAHLLAGLALFGLVRRTLLLPRWPDHYRASADQLAFAVALLWLVHPLQTQSVTYLIQRCESFMGLFLLVAVYCAARAWDSARGGLWAAAAVAAAFLSAACKEVAVTIPVLVALYDWTFRPDGPLTLLRRRWPFYLALTAAAWAFFAAGLLTADPDAPSTVGFNVRNVTPLGYLFTQAGVLVHYLRLAVWPSGLALDYLGWPAAATVDDWLAPGLVVAAGLLATAWGLARRAWYGFVGAWFFVILAPTSSFVPIADFVFEHRMYLPLASVVVLAVVGIDALLRAVCPTPALAGRLATGLLVVTAAALTVRTIARNEDYRTSEALYASDVALRPDAYRARVNLALALNDRGETAAAIDLASEALELALGRADYRLQVARLHYTDGRIDRAIALLAPHVERMVPPQARAFQLLGQARLLQGDAATAEADYRRAAAIDPGNLRTYPYLALILADRRADEAAAAREDALRRDPGAPRALALAARRLAASQADADGFSTKERRDRLRKEALLAARAACVLTEDEDAACLDALAVALAASERYPEAAEVARRAVAAARKGDDAALAAAVAIRAGLFEDGQPLTRDAYRQAAAPEAQP